MKRRGFFGALFAGAAAPVAAAIGGKLADAELALPVEAKPIGKPLDIESIEPMSEFYCSASSPVNDYATVLAYVSDIVKSEATPHGYNYYGPRNVRKVF